LDVKRVSARVQVMHGSILDAATNSYSRITSVALVSSTFAPEEHLKEMASIAQSLWLSNKGMLQTEKEKAGFSHDHLILHKRRNTWKPDGR